MAGETVITIVGNLTRDPELRTLGNGSTVANLTIASSTRQFNRQSNQWEDGDTLFMNCSAWDSQKQKLASNREKPTHRVHDCLDRDINEYRHYLTLMTPPALAAKEDRS